MINITDLTGANLSLTDLGLSVTNPSNAPLNVTVLRQSLTFPQIIFYAYCIFIVAVIVHEVGHYLVLRKYSPNTSIKIYFDKWLPHIQTGVQEDYDVLTPSQKIEVYIWGIIAGLIPIVLAFLVHPIYFVLLGPYFVGLMNDLKLIKKYWSVK